MKKWFLKAASATIAVAATLAFCAGSAVAANENPVFSDFFVDSETMAKNNEYAEAYEKFYDEALQEEISKIDFEAYLDDFFSNQDQGVFAESPQSIAREKAQKIAEEKCEELGLSVAVELTPLVNSAYPGWQGTFLVDSIEDTTLTFTSPYYFNCTVGNRTGKITARNGYSGNLKSVSVDITYADGTTDHKYGRSNDSPFSVSASYQNKTIVKATYKFTILDGTGSAADYLELATVNLVRNGT